MNTFLEVVRSALGVWWLWLFLGVCAVIAWKTPKRECTKSNPAILGSTITPLSDTHLSDCSLSPYSLSNQFRNRF